MPEKIRRIQLIKMEFPTLTMGDAKALTDTDKSQLASAIARNQGRAPEDLDFALVEY